MNGGYVIGAVKYCESVDDGKLKAGNAFDKGRMLFHTSTDPLSCAEPKSGTKEERARHVTGWWHTANCGGKVDGKNKEGCLTASGEDFYWHSAPMEQALKTEAASSSPRAEPLASAEIWMG